MPQKFNHRSVGPFLKAVQRFLRGKGHTEALRFADIIAARDQPPPEVPGGPYHKTSKIYYYTRDARREVQPPFEIPMGRQITDGSAAAEVKTVTPNKVYLQ
ncbi:NADH dehydrogenase [ubiquinone] 1 alpha subcomplex subunit 7-like [Venturia canescens]|uniref:NADH dehydrogenase [ubiquinone] 1 alpha subcomplex subunit 7-like n=1 Tax=Venturia canescens TaxID=32260 RepID=UPI001C9C6ACD|nr:NADH dehydrogenase [ubiquinone] 1 alpha subcomplex subunit 7-like [Venturia canescens]